MSTDRFSKLLQVVGEEDEKELKLAHNSRIKTLNDYQLKPGRETKADLDAARDFYQETVDRLWLIHFPGDVEVPDGECFANKKAALSWIITNHGNIVSQGKFYTDCGNNAVTVYPDKRVSRFSVLEYVLKLKSKNGSSPAPGDADLDARKQRADVERAEADLRTARVKADEAERDRDARWMQREEHEDAMAAFAGLAEDIFRHRVYLDHQQLLTVAGGDHSRAAEFAHALQAFCDRGFNDIAGYKEIDLEFAEEDDA